MTTPSESISPSRRQRTIRWAVTAGILCLFAASLVLLQMHGAASRRYIGPARDLSDPELPVFLVHDAPGLYARYRAAAVHGRVLVHAGKYLHFVDIEDIKVYGGFHAFPITLFDVMQVYEKRIDYRNVLWVGMQGNLFREIAYLVPPEVMREKRAALRPTDSDVVSVSDASIVAHDWGSRRTILDRVPAIGETVVLNIDASLFDRPGTPAVLDQLMQSGLRIDMVTLNISEDNPDIPAANRDRLRRYAATTFGRSLHEE